jgi:aarF domain-containing kinase
VQLSFLAAPLLVLLPFTYVSERAGNLSWSYALWGIEQAGPTYIKLTQWATTRQDLFSTEFCQYFGKLRNETVGHSWDETKQILKEQGDQFLEYVSLDEVPIGSGCIAQVYRGRLRKPCGQHPEGTDIAIKVQHPGIWRKVCVDFYIFDKISSILEDLPLLNLKYLSLRDTVRQFRDIMLPQLDLTLEMKHLNRFNRDFASDKQVSFPYPIEGLTSTLVLTETFIKGKSIMEFTDKDTPLDVKKELADLGLTTTLKMMFVHDFLHGDLHPGNILVSTNDKNKLVMHLLDCGLVVEVGPEQHVNMIKILGAFTRRNGRLAGQLMVDTSRDCQAGPDDMELFVHGIELICVQDEDHNFIEKIGDYIADICYLACKHKVKLEASFINMALGIEIMEGIATALNPDIQVAKVALPMVLQAEIMHRLPKFNLW